MNFKSIDDVLNYAIKQEEISANFYLELARKASTPIVAKTFEGFAREELNHKTKLEGFQKGEQIKFVDERVKDLKIADYLVEGSYDDSTTYLDAMILAMKKEKAAYKLYCDLAEISNDEGLKSAFLYLAQEEAKHKLRFELEYDEFVSKE